MIDLTKENFEEEVLKTAVPVKVYQNIALGL